MLNWLSDKGLSIKIYLNDEVRPKVEQEFLRRTLKYQTASSSLCTSVALLNLFRYSYQLYRNIKQKIIRNLLLQSHLQMMTGASGKSTGIQVALLSGIGYGHIMTSMTKSTRQASVYPA